MDYEVDSAVIVKYITSSPLVVSALSGQLGVTAEELTSALSDNPKWTVTKAGKWTLVVGSKKLVANPSKTERKISFTVS